MFSNELTIYIVEHYISTESYQKPIFLFEYKFLSISPPNEASISHLGKKFCEEDAVKNLPCQRRC